jgi:hypothetical protein
MDSYESRRVEGLDRAARLRVDVQVHQSEDWAAVYLDGKLQMAGDSYLAVEWVYTFFGVTSVQDDAFLVGGREAASTLDEVEAYARQRAARQQKAAELRAQAEELLRGAKELEE